MSTKPNLNLLITKQGNIASLFPSITSIDSLASLKIYIPPPVIKANEKVTFPSLPKEKEKVIIFPNFPVQID
jgi:hypothetical protein